MTIHENARNALDTARFFGVVVLLTVALVFIAGAITALTTTLLGLVLWPFIGRFSLDAALWAYNGLMVVGYVYWLLVQPAIDRLKSHLARPTPQEDKT